MCVTSECVNAASVCAVDPAITTQNWISKVVFFMGWGIKMLFAETNHPTVRKQAPASDALVRSTRGRQNTATVNFGFQLSYEMLQKTRHGELA